MDNILKTIQDRLNINQPASTQIIDTDTAISCLNTYKRKLQVSGLTGNPSADMEGLMKNSFELALASSPSTEQVIVEPTNLTQLAIIREESSPDWDEVKNIISMSLDSGIDVGKNITWIRHDSHHLVVSQRLTVKGYFTGEVIWCNFLLNWEVAGQTYSQWIVIDKMYGDKNSFETITGGSAYIDTGNTMTIFLGAHDDKVYPKRYDRLIINGKAWRIESVNAMENSKLLRYYLQEHYIDESKDNTETQIANNTVKPSDSLKDRVLDDLLGE